MTAPSQTPVIVATPSREFGERMRAALAENDLSAEVFATLSEALARLKQQKPVAFVLDARKESFAEALKFSAELHPDTPVQVIDGGALFCAYPLARQPAAIIDAIRAAGVLIAPGLLRHMGSAVNLPIPGDAFLVQ